MNATRITRSEQKHAEWAVVAVAVVQGRGERSRQEEGGGTEAVERAASSSPERRVVRLYLALPLALALPAAAAVLAALGAALGLVSDSSSAVGAETSSRLMSLARTGPELAA